MEKFINRIGTVKNCFDIEIVVHSIEISVLEVANFKVAWERRNKSCETKDFVVAPNCRVTSIEHTLFMSNTVYRKGTEFMQKEAKIKLKHRIGNEWVSVAFITIDLAFYIEKAISNNQFVTEYQGSQCKLCLSIKAYKSENAGSGGTISKSISEVHSRYDTLYSLLTSSLKEISEIRDNIKSCKEEIKSYKDNTNNELLAAKAQRQAKELADVKKRLNEEKGLQSRLEESLMSINLKIADAVKEQAEEKELSEIDGRLKDIIKRHTVFQK